MTIPKPRRSTKTMTKRMASGRRSLTRAECNPSRASPPGVFGRFFARGGSHAPVDALEVVVRDGERHVPEAREPLELDAPAHDVQRERDAVALGERERGEGQRHLQ